MKNKDLFITLPLALLAIFIFTVSGSIFLQNRYEEENRIACQKAKSNEASGSMETFFGEYACTILKDRAWIEKKAEEWMSPFLIKSEARKANRQNMASNELLFYGALLGLFVGLILSTTGGLFFNIESNVGDLLISLLGFFITMGSLALLFVLSGATS